MPHPERWFGRYGAEIVNRNDPAGRGRLLVRVPALGASEAVWAERVFTDAGDEEPANGDTIIVEFLEGDPGRPIWTGWLRNPKPS